MNLQHLALAVLFVPACLGDEGTVAGPSTVAADTTPLPDTASVTAAPDASTPETSAPDVERPRGLVVHEWGTFTSVQDPNGDSQPGLHHEDEELPAWVYRRDFGPNAYFEELPEEPLQQLETPVLYFHSDERLAVQVDVDFPEGLISQWYPGATSYAPEPWTASAIAGGSMRWDVTLEPTVTADSFLPVDPQEIWAPSRNVASTPVVMTRDGYEEREQFIFYRGLGRFDLPVRIRVPNDDLVSIENRSPDAIAALVILNAGADGGAVTTLGGLAAGQTLSTAVPRAFVPFRDYVAQAHDALKTAILATGLYDDEAEAMVDTWTRSWFGNPGIRVLYIVPRSWTDRLLPIRVTPAPTELVRTLVGRIEVMTPAIVAATQERISQLGDNPQWDALEQTIDTLGRFAEPWIRHALAQGGAQATAQQLLDAAHQRP